MLRKGLLILGGALALLAVIGLVVDRQATMLWFVVIAAILSIGGAFVVEDEHALELSRGLGPTVIGLGLVAVVVVGFAAHQPAWAVWLTLLIGLGELILGGALYAQRHHELQTHAHA
jgi:hypothetical protein